MDNILDSILDFIGKLVTASLLGGVVLITAGEVRLAALKNVKHGSSRLSVFTERMTKPYTAKKRGLHEASR